MMYPGNVITKLQFLILIIVLHYQNETVELNRHFRVR